MEEDRWKYKVGGRPVGLIPALVLLAVFGGLSIWLYCSHNGAFLFTLFLTAATFVLILCCIYRAVFVKVLFGERGFYHQTQPGNGRYFRYSEILKAWESAGKESNGTTGYFCTCETIDGQVLRFPFLPGESDGIGYFLDCVNSRTGGEASRVPQDDGREYTIDGKTNGLAAMIICLALAVFFSVLAADQLQPQPNKYVAAAFGFGGIAVAFLALLIRLSIRYFYFQVRIGTTGFSFRSHPLNGRYYSYCDIKSCRVEHRMVRYRTARGSARRTFYADYFIFTDQNGRTTRFPFQNSVFEHEIHILQERMKKAEKGPVKG